VRRDAEASTASSGVWRYIVAMPSLPRGASLLGAVLLVLGCSSAPGTGATGPSAAPSGATGPAAGATCPTAPAPAAADLGAWGSPTTAPTLTPYLVSNFVSCGDARILFLFLDAKNNDVSAPTRTAKVAFYDLGKDPRMPVATVDGEFIWTIQDVRGMYIANVKLPEAGQWGAEFTTQAPGSPAETTRLTFEVHDDSPWIAVGERAPASKSPTLADVGGDVSLISTDQKPDPAFYQTSVADALAAHKPFFLIFATPKFCTTAQCGPTLDRFKPVAAANPDVTFINVEPYQLKSVDGELQPVLDAKGQLQATPTTTEWGLYFEPWMFAVDRQGVVRGSYEVAMSDQELATILKTITTGS
jgi:hypothetical protein